MFKETRDQIPDEAVYISHNINKPGKGIYPAILFPNR